MKQDEVKVGGKYATKIGDQLVRVEVVHEEMPTSWSPRTRYAVRRVFSDGSVGPVLPKRRTAAALRPLKIPAQVAVVDACGFCGAKAGMVDGSRGWPECAACGGV